MSGRIRGGVIVAGAVLAVVAAGGYHATVAEVALPLVASNTPSFTEQEAGFEAEPVAEATNYRVGQGGWYTLAELAAWERQPGPLRVGLQVGHLENDQVPAELSGLTRNGAGATAAGYTERDTVAVIARLVAAELTAAGIAVDILPATVPPGYEADAFVSIHADGNANTSVRGFKIAGPRRDYSGRSAILVESLEAAYAAATELPQDPQITRRMSAYYAFNWPRYKHAVHPFTPAAIVETGFLSNPADRAFLINQPDVVAAGIAAGIQDFLAAAAPVEPSPASLAAPTLPLTGEVTCAPVRAERRGRDARPCEAALQTADGEHYLLVQDPAVATSTLPYPATVMGKYMPVQMLSNYFWFPWEVRGLIEVASLQRKPTVE
ncbi:MAG: N-acetylmuramoyl-L-alanine amidase family protein [Patescibacteria group bacterium]